MEHCHIKCSCGKTITLKVCHTQEEPEFKYKTKPWTHEETVQLKKIFNGGCRDTEILTEALDRHLVEIEYKLLYEDLVTGEEIRNGILYDGAKKRMRDAALSLKTTKPERLVKDSKTLKSFIKFLR